MSSETEREALAQRDAAWRAIREARRWLNASGGDRAKMAIANALRELNAVHDDAFPTAANPAEPSRNDRQVNALAAGFVTGEGPWIAEPPRTVTGDGAGELPEPVWTEAPVSGWEWWLKQDERIIAKVIAFGGNRPPFHAEFPLTCRLGEFATLEGARAAVEQALKGQDAEPFQARVQPWLLACFGVDLTVDTSERNHRFLEEALELVQACGCTPSEAHQLVDYVFGRAIGEKPQEVGGVMISLAALCLAQNLDLHAAGEAELARVWTKVEAIRAKQKTKPKHSPLPQAVAEPATVSLTDEQIDKLWAEACRQERSTQQFVRSFARAVVAATSPKVRDDFDEALYALRELVEIRDLRRSHAAASAHAQQFPTDENYAVIDQIAHQLHKRDAAAWETAREIVALHVASRTAS